MFSFLQVFGDILDTTDLIRSCVQAAVSMLRDAAEGGELSTKRVENLLTLLDGSLTQGYKISYLLILGQCSLWRVKIYPAEKKFCKGILFYRCVCTHCAKISALAVRGL